MLFRSCYDSSVTSYMKENENFVTNNKDVVADTSSGKVMSSRRHGRHSGSKMAADCSFSATKDILYKRRLAANARERRRMNALNSAFDCLRRVLPGPEVADRKLSKYETLQMAQTYIQALVEVLEDSDVTAKDGQGKDD